MEKKNKVLLFVLVTLLAAVIGIWMLLYYKAKQDIARHVTTVLDNTNIEDMYYDMFSMFGEYNNIDYILALQFQLFGFAVMENNVVEEFEMYPIWFLTTSGIVVESSTVGLNNKINLLKKK